MTGIGRLTVRREGNDETTAGRDDDPDSHEGNESSYLVRETRSEHAMSLVRFDRAGGRTVLSGRSWCPRRDHVGSQRRACGTGACSEGATLCGTAYFTMGSARLPGTRRLPGETLRRRNERSAVDGRGDARIGGRLMRERSRQ